MSFGGQSQEAASRTALPHPRTKQQKIWGKSPTFFSKKPPIIFKKNVARNTQNELTFLTSTFDIKKDFLLIKKKPHIQEAQTQIRNRNSTQSRIPIQLWVKLQIDFESKRNSDLKSFPKWNRNATLKPNRYSLWKSLLEDKSFFHSS